MQRINPDLDIIKDILEAVIKAQPHSTFAKSLLHQYIERGGLSKKQLEGLHSKASKVDTIPPGKLATLEAIILKKPNRYKSEKPTIIHEEKTNDVLLSNLLAILEKFPAHKRVLFIKAKYDQRQKITPQEITEIERFKKLLLP